MCQRFNCLMLLLKDSLPKMLCIWSLLLPIQSAYADFEEDYEAKQWQEIVVQLPPAPNKEAFLPFYVSAASGNDFFVDGSSLSVGEDGVIRFVLVVQTAGGAQNISYEGMRCLTRERRIYASGRLDGSWSKSRNNEWTRIRDAVANRQYAALFLDYFCPGGLIVRNPEEARDALRQGGHPDNKRW